MPYVVRPAMSPEDQSAVFRFRYRVYIEEMKRRQVYADHAGKTIREPLDESAWLLAAWHDGRVVGTVRINKFSSPGLEYYRKLYRMDLFGDLPLNHVTITSKLMVLSEFRNSRAALSLFHHVATFYADQKIQLDFIDCNRPVESIFRQLEYRRYTAPVFHREYGKVIPMVLAVTDLPHLESLPSPCLKFVKHMQVHRSLLERTRAIIEAHQTASRATSRHERRNSPAKPAAKH